MNQILLTNRVCNPWTTVARFISGGTQWNYVPETFPSGGSRCGDDEWL